MGNLTKIRLYNKNQRILSYSKSLELSEENFLNLKIELVEPFSSYEYGTTNYINLVHRIKMQMLLIYYLNKDGLLALNEQQLDFVFSLLTKDSVLNKHDFFYQNLTLDLKQNLSRTDIFSSHTFEVYSLVQDINLFSSYQHPLVCFLKEYNLGKPLLMQFKKKQEMVLNQQKIDFKNKVNKNLFNFQILLLIIFGFYVLYTHYLK